MLEIKLTPADSGRLANLCGHLDENIQQIERYLNVKIHSRGDRFQVIGEEKPAKMATDVIGELYAETGDSALTPRHVHLYLQKIIGKQTHEDNRLNSNGERQEKNSGESRVLQTRSSSIKTNNEHQQIYLKNIDRFAVNFAVGPAGTGKTFLAVAAAVRAFEREQVHRLVLVRPAVEAGERLGFLPGDMSQKIDPYLRPLYDALHQLMGGDTVARLIERGDIEVLPLAYMRGRTLNDSFIILDEAQNTTTAQMKMFLTRIGFGSTAVITGDVTQIDLPADSSSGLVHVLKVLRKVKDIGFVTFDSSDVVRHPLVQKIIDAYTVWEEKDKSDKEIDT